MLLRKVVQFEVSEIERPVVCSAERRKTRYTVTGGKLKAEGVTAGVSDLILLKSNRDYGALLIEMKKKGGYQSPSQKEWQKIICENGEYKYVLCFSLDDFIREVDDYLRNEF